MQPFRGAWQRRTHCRSGKVEQRLLGLPGLSFKLAWRKKLGRWKLLEEAASGLSRYCLVRSPAGVGLCQKLARTSSQVRSLSEAVTASSDDASRRRLAQADQKMTGRVACCLQGHEDRRLLLLRSSLLRSWLLWRLGSWFSSWLGGLRCWGFGGCWLGGLLAGCHSGGSSVRASIIGNVVMLGTPSEQSRRIELAMLRQTPVGSVWNSLSALNYPTPGFNQDATCFVKAN